MSRRSLRASGALVALVACGGDPASPPIAPLPMPSASAIPSALADASVADAATPDAAPPTTSKRRADVLASYDESLLFADEIARLDEVARENMAARPLPSIEILSHDEHAQLEALFASGRLRKGGPVCALPPSRSRIANANVGGLAITLRFVCSESAACDIRAELVDGGGPPERFAYRPQLDNWAPVVRAKIDVATGGDVAAIERALRATPVQPFTWAKRAPPLRSAPVRHPGHRTIAVRIASGWPTPPTAADFASVQPAIDACVGTKLFPVGVVVAVAPGGTVARCEPAGGDDDSLATCTCHALAKKSFGAATGDRRLLVQVERAVAKGTHAIPMGAATPDRRAKIEISASPAELPLAEDWELSDSIGVASQAMAACFQALPASRDDDTTLALEVDEAGFVKQATLTDAAWMTDSQRACAQKAGEGMKLQAPLVDAQRHLKITVSVGR